MPPVLQTLPAERPGVPAEADLLEKRAQFAATEIDPALGVDAVDREYAGVPCRVINDGAETTLLYLHGGGYRMGSAAAYNAYGAALASAGAARVILPEYRLAPENPFPAGLRDACAVYEAVAAESGDPLVVGGDSAGAGLAVAVTASALRAGLRAPDGLLLLSPWLDIRCVSPFYETATDMFFPLATASAASADYLQGAAADHPLASPLLGEFAGFPPTLIQVGGTEALVGDALDLTTKLAGLDIACTLEVVAGQGHTWPLIFPQHVDALASTASVGRFIDAVTRRAVIGS